MSKPSRFLLYAVFSALTLSAVGLVVGMFYNLFVVLVRHAQLDAALSASILYYKTVGALGILGMVLFFAFLLSLLASGEDKKR